jgi:hypothetical protein
MRLRILALFLFLFSPAITFSCSTTAPAPSASPALRGLVADPSGAIVSGAEVDLVDPSGAVAASFHSDGEGNFQVTAPHPGRYTLVISQPGFETVKTPVVLNAAGGSLVSAPAASTLAPLLRIVLPIASFATNVRVSAESNTDLTASEENRDSSVMTSQELKELPIFDNDYATAMSAFLDDSATATGGSGLLVDGVEANRATVSASAVQEVRINQDPYSAQYYWPGRGQMEIITKAAAEHYHGEFNFLFRNSAMNAQNALAPSKPFEQRQNYEGSVTGPIPHTPKSSFLGSFNRVIYDQDAVVSATIPAVGNSAGAAFNANVPAPARDTEFSLRAARQFGSRHSAYAQYSYQDWTGQNQAVGGQTLAAAGYNSQYREDDVVIHVDSTPSPVLLNQLSLVAEHDSNRNRDAVDVETWRDNVAGDFTGGSAQNDSFSSEYNFRIYEMATWTRGRNLVKLGAGTPHISRRAFDDNTNEQGTYTFAPTMEADGVTVKETALQNYAANLPTGFSQNAGETHFVYHQQEMGAFIQDQFKVNARFSITPGLRYDWQNFLATRRLGFAPRLSFAWVLDEDSKLVVRGGGGIYYDRFGAGPLLDLVRYEKPRRQALLFPLLDPSLQPASGCVPVTAACELAGQGPEASRAELAPNAKIPYQIQYGLSIERQLGEKATGIVSVYSARGIDSFRSVDINAPTLASGYTERPDSAFGRIRQMQPEGFWEGDGMDISYRGRLNKYFTGFGRYTWSHFESDTGGIGWFPQNQSDPNDEWSNANWDRRHRLGMYAIFQPQSLMNLSAGIFANTGTPWTVLTGTDTDGDKLYNSRPEGVERNTETNPSYVDLDLRWGHDFAFTANKAEDAPRLGLSAGAFNVLNHVNGGGIDPVETSSSFGQITSAAPPRRIQLGMRFEF